MKPVSKYYKQQQYNVLHTAIDNVDRFNISIKGNDHLTGFVVSSNLTSDLMKELNALGYQITKKSK